IITYLMDYKWLLVLVIFMVLISSSMGLLGPYLVGMAIDDFIDMQKTDGLLTLIGWLILIYILHSSSIFLQNFWMVGIVTKTVFNLRKELFEKFHQLPISFFDKSQQGELIIRVTNDIDNINNTFKYSIIHMIASIISIL